MSKTKIQKHSPKRSLINSSGVYRAVFALSTLMTFGFNGVANATGVVHIPVQPAYVQGSQQLKATK